MARRRRDSATRHFSAIAQELMRRKRVSVYDVANVLGVSPNYARALMMMFASSPYVKRELSRMSLRVIYLRGCLMLVRAESVTHFFEGYEGGE